MLIMILGILGWYHAHSFKTTAPHWRENFFEKHGSKARGFFAIYILSSVILMIIGYKSWSSAQLFVAPAWTNGLVVILGFIAFLLTGVGNSKSRLRGKMRHPMLIGFAIWSVAHIIASGTMKGLVLWGAMLAWALIWMQLINKREGEWKPSSFVGTKAGDVRLLGITAVLVVVILAIHAWLLY